jgi:transcriptional/translational regulatory protein YebC/TACO1
MVLKHTSRINKDDVELIAIEAGAEDIDWQEDTLYVYTKLEDLEKTKKILEEKKFKIESANLEWVPKENISVNDDVKEKNQKLFESLDENDDVQNIYTNI